MPLIRSAPTLDLWGTVSAQSGATLRSRSMGDGGSVTTTITLTVDGGNPLGR